MTDSPHAHPAYQPPPWNLTGETYTILTSNPKGVDHRSPGVYGQLEAQSDFANEEKSGKFKGGVMGLGFILVIRYHTSPVGPYDELAYIPGQFETPGGNSHLRITNIYVSSEDSIYNGRRIWNIPKQLATFSFTQLPQQGTRPGPKRVHIKVSQPHMDGSKPNPPFFSAICTLNSYRYIPSFPFNTSYIPPMRFTTQPPLPGSQESYCEISTDQWRTFKSTMKGKASLMSVQSADDDSDDGGENIARGEFGDGVHFPKIKPVYGFHGEGIVIMVSEPVDEVTGKK